MLDQLLLEYGNKLKVIKKYQEGIEKGDGWKNIRNYLDGIEYSLKILGYEEELNNYLSKIEQNTSTAEYEFKYGIITSEGNKKMCKCGLFTEKRKWETAYTSVCELCDNTKWVEIKSGKYTWKKFESTAETVDKTDSIEIIRTDIKYNIDWGNETLSFKENNKSMLVDLKEREIYILNGKKKSLATMSNLNGFLSGIYDMNIIKDLLEYYNKNERYWKIFLNNNFFSISLMDFYFYLKYPQLTLINNYFNMNYIRDLETKINNVNKEETSIHKMLGISKRVLRFIKEKEIKFDNLVTYKVFIKNHGVDNFINAYELMITRNRYYRNTIIDKIGFLLDRGYKIKELERYFDRVDEQQGISDLDNILTLMRDYIRMSEDMEVKYHRYSRSLKLHHDVRSRDYKVVISEQETELFHKRYEERSNLSYKDNEFSIILPNEPVDVTREGQDLNHCVSSYVKRIVTGETLIVFMRDNSNVEKSLITIEIKNNSIVQARGKSNRKLNPKEKSFIGKWANVKDLVMNFY